jgi:hypothetical protein
MVQRYLTQKDVPISVFLCELCFIAALPAKMRAVRHR